MTSRHLLRAVRVALAAATSVAVVVGGASVASAAPSGSGTDLVTGPCPALFALGVQGTGESAPDAAPTTDTGMLSQVFMPLLAKAVSRDTELAGRAYVPYDAGFGGAVPGGNVPYMQSVQGAEQGIDSMAAEVAAACPNTKFTAAGYSQGAQAVSTWAQRVGAGQGSIPADKLVGVATFGDPTRAAGSPLFPGAPGQTTPEPAPGTTGTEVSKIEALDQTTPTGGGIAPTSNTVSGYGALTGRVASFCQAGDLACDAPSDSPILRVVTNVAGQAELSAGDPLRSLASVTEAMAMTSVKTAVTVVNEDVKGTTLANLSIAPKKSLSERLAIASDPSTPLPTADQAISALLKVGTIGFNAVTTVAKEVLTPANIAELAMVGMSNPVAAVALLGTKILGAAVKLVPPATMSRLTNQAFAAVKDNITDNKDLLNLATLTKYSTTIAQHNSYGSTPITPAGESATSFVTEWFVALAKDLTSESAGNHDVDAATGSAPSPPTPITTGVAAPPATRPTPAPEATAPTN